MKRLLLVLFFLTGCISFSYGDTVTVAINHFAIKENPFAQDEVAIVATDSLGTIRENVNGMFNFTVNGLEDTLKFNQGTAFYHHKLLRSTFLYVRHQNDSGVHSILYYVYRTDEKLTLVHIPWVWLLAIPCGLFLLAYMFKRFIVLAVIIFAIFVFFNYHNGLTFSAFFENIIDGLKHIL